MVFEPECYQTSYDEESSHHNPKKHIASDVVEEQVVKKQTAYSSRPRSQQEDTDFDALDEQ